LPGLDVFFALLAPVLPSLVRILRYIRYAIVSLWEMFGAPWVFVKVRSVKKQ